MGDFWIHLYEEVSISRGKLTTLLDLYKVGNMSDIGDYIDNLTENESKMILRMVLYGAWKDLAKIEAYERQG